MQDATAPEPKPELLRPAIFGLVAAVGSGVLWGECTFSRDNPPVYWALGCGLLVGLVVRTTARGRREWPVGLIALVAALTSAFVSKYLVCFGELLFSISLAHGWRVANSVSVTLLASPGVLHQFLVHLPEFVQPPERPWILGGAALAVAVALLPGRTRVRS
jgi:hypothetical protein